MSNPPLRRGPLLVWLLRLLPPLAIFLGSAELYVRYFVYDTIYRDNACIAYRREGEDPLAPHRFFRPICRVRVESVNGGEFEIVTNEDGLRDRPRAEFRDGAIAILGDSHVEGFAFAVEHSVGRRLEALAGPALGGKVLNLGFRGTGPSEQLRILDWIHPHYKILGAIWILTENDILDEFYFHHLKRGGPLTRLSQLLTVVSEKIFFRRWYSFEWLRLVAHSVAMTRSLDAAYDQPALARQFCEAVTSIRRRLPQGAPIHVIGIPHGKVGDELPYFGAKLDKDTFWKALDCARATGISVVDQREFYSSLSPHYLPDRYHLDAEGTDLWARRILADLRISP